MDQAIEEKRADAEAYELSEEQNVDVRSVGSHAITWGLVCAVVGLACLALAIHGTNGKVPSVGWRLYVPAGVVNAIAGINFVVAGRDFRAAVHRRGCDVGHVMLGLSHLSRAVLVQVIVTLATAGLVVVGALFVGGP